VPEYNAHVAKLAREGKLPAVAASEESSGADSMPGLNPNSSEDESASPSSNTRRRERRKQRKGKGKEKSKMAKKKGKARARSPPSRERPPKRRKANAGVAKDKVCCLVVCFRYGICFSTLAKLVCKSSYRYELLQTSFARVHTRMNSCESKDLKAAAIT
jgi:hypothetical protein